MWWDVAVPFADGAGTLILALLVAESVLIVLTLVLIALSRRETRSRVELLDQLVVTAEVLSRREYFATTIHAIQDADRSVEGMVTGSPPEDHAAPVDRILDTIEQAVDRGVTVRYLLPIGRERLQMGHRYTEAGAEIRYHPGLLAGDARFMVVDDETVVLGFPDRPGGEAPTRRGQRVHSEKVGRLFLEDFEDKWDAPDTMTLDDYLRHVVSDVAASHPKASAQRIAADLQVPRGQVETCLEGLQPDEALA